MTDISGRAVLLTPPPTTADRTPRITWTNVIGASHYVFQLDSLSANQTVVRADNLTDIEFIPEVSIAPGNYRAWVRAIGGDNGISGPWSLKLDFTVTALDSSIESEFELQPVLTLGVSDLLANGRRSSNPEMSDKAAAERPSLPPYTPTKDSIQPTDPVNTDSEDASHESPQHTDIDVIMSDLDRSALYYGASDAQNLTPF